MRFVAGTPAQHFIGLSRNRHVLYCRQRQLKQHHSRKKSCTLCRRAKTRCSETVPQCARCKVKGLVCKYDGERRIDFDVQLLELGERESNIDGVVGVTALGAEPTLLAGHMWQSTSLDMNHEEPFQVDLQPNNLTLSHNSVMDSLQNIPTNFNWEFPIPQYGSLNYGLETSQLDQIAQDMCNSTSQSITSSYTGRGQVAGHLPTELR
jgi:hypothetical protein